MKTLAILDIFISEELKQDVMSHSKARITSGITILLAVIILLNSVRGFVQQQYKLGMIVAVVGLLFLAALLILKKTSYSLLAGNYILFLYWGMLTYVIGSGSGISSLITSAFVPFVFTAFLLTGLRAGLAWGFIALGTVTVLKLMEMNGYVFERLGEDQTYYINAFANLANVTILGAIFAYSSASNLKKSFVLQKNAEKVSAEQQQMLAETNSVMNAVSEGDLSQRISIDLEGELGELKSSINGVLAMLGNTISKVIVSSTQILAGSNQLAEAAQSLASGTTQQAASIEEISSSMNEIGAMAKTNNENATQARKLSLQNSSEAVEGNRQMEDMLKSMTEINDTSSNVSKVIKVIDDIASQTNLLALNAAVEAARAGKYGKGFAVVAEEVRNLAARSAEAAKDTTGLIERSSKEVENGVENADQTAEILKGFTEKIEKVNNFIEEISSASQEQTTAVNEINASMNQVNQVIQQNSSISEETASSSQELAIQAKTLQERMSSFIIQTERSPQTESIQYRRPEPQLLKQPQRSQEIETRKLISPFENGRNKSGKKIFLDEERFDKS